jgi:hypothetical protein
MLNVERLEHPNGNASGIVNAWYRLFPEGNPGLRIEKKACESFDPNNDISEHESRLCAGLRCFGIQVVKKVVAFVEKSSYDISWSDNLFICYVFRGH